MEVVQLFLPFSLSHSIRAQGRIFLSIGPDHSIIAAIVFLLRLTMFNIMDSHVDLNRREIRSGVISSAHIVHIINFMPVSFEQSRILLRTT